MKTILFYIIFFVSAYNYAQDSINYYNKNIETSYKKNDRNGSHNFFKKKLNYLKTSDNLEEYFYAYFDYFLLDPQIERISILKNADKNKWREPKTNNEKIAKLHVLVNIAYHLKEFGFISKATSVYENAWFYHKNSKIKNYDIVEYCLKPLANNYMRLGDYIRAESIIKNTIQTIEKIKNTDQLVATYLNLSNLYTLTGKTKKANDLLQNIVLNQTKNKEQKSDIYTKIATNYYESGDYVNTQKFITKSINEKPNLSTQLKNMSLGGLLYYAKGEYKNAKSHFNFTYNFTKNDFKKNNRELNKLLLLTAQTNLKLNDLNAALTNYQLVLQNLLLNFKPSSVDNHPNENLLYAENILLDAFEGKSKVLEILEKKELALENLEMANIVADLLRETYTSQQSKIIQQTKNRKRTEDLVRLYHNLFKTTNDKTFLEKMFLSIEKSKAIVLHNELKFKNLKYTKDSLFILRENLKEEKAFVNNKIILEELKDKKADIHFIKNQGTIKINLTEKLQALNKKLNTKYPFLNTNNKQLTIVNLQQDLLEEHQLLVSFFETKNNWFIFSLNITEGLKLRVLLKDEKLNTQITNYINFFFYNNGESIKNNVNAFKKTASFLYEKLLQPELEKPYQHLTIIPDKKLNFVAFDALLTEETNSSNFTNFPYLVKNVAINLNFSANILYVLKQRQSQNIDSKYLGYFPVFKNKQRNLQHLPNTLEEQISFKKYTNANSFIEEKATKKHFLAQYKNYNQIHLATHASAGNFLKPAVIEFYDESLHLPEIYGLNMQTDLLVLSACETGVGKMQKGEGVMSLSRGFTYAGVKNMVVSLWKVNDKATSELMRNFYKNLKNNSKIEAIHKAKLDYLNNDNISNIKKSPYYWSSFIFVGNMETVAINNYWDYIIIGGFLLLSLLIFTLKFKKQK